MCVKAEHGFAYLLLHSGGRDRQIVELFLAARLALDSVRDRFSGNKEERTEMEQNT